MKEDSNPAKNHAAVPHEAWLAARWALLEKEKEITRLGDELRRTQRALPWEAITKAYTFDGLRGIDGLFARAPEDELRLERGGMIFESFYQSFVE